MSSPPTSGKKVSDGARAMVSCWVPGVQAIVCAVLLVPERRRRRRPATARCVPTGLTDAICQCVHPRKPEIRWRFSIRHEELRLGVGGGRGGCQGLLRSGSPPSISDALRWRPWPLNRVFDRPWRLAPPARVGLPQKQDTLPEACGYAADRACHAATLSCLLAPLCARPTGAQSQFSKALALGTRKGQEPRRCTRTWTRCELCS